MTAEGSAWLRAAIAEARASRVRPNMARAGELITIARKHIGSAERVAESDPTLALTACHDAVRKAIDGHAGARGVRIENVPGHHKLVLDYARYEIEAVDDDALREADRLRDRRNEFEYARSPERALRPDEIAEHVETARAIVEAVAAALAVLVEPTD